MRLPLHTGTAASSSLTAVLLHATVQDMFIAPLYQHHASHALVSQACGPPATNAELIAAVRLHVSPFARSAPRGSGPAAGAGVPGGDGLRHGGRGAALRRRYDGGRCGAADRRVRRPLLLLLLLRAGARATHVPHVPPTSHPRAIMCSRLLPVPPRARASQGLI